MKKHYNRVLLSENNEKIRNELCSHLYAHGLQVDIAPSTLMVLELCENEYDAVLLGPHLSGLSSPIVAKIINQKRPNLAFCISKTSVLKKWLLKRCQKNQYELIAIQDNRKGENLCPTIY